MKTLTRARATRAVLRASIAFLVWLASTIFSVFALAQDAPLTRQQEWRHLREAKSKSLRPYQPGSLEAGTLYVQKEKRLERFTKGWKGLHPKLGGLSTGSGFAGGMRYPPQIAEGRVNFQRSGAISPVCVSSTISSGARPSCWVTHCSPNFIRVTGATRRRISMGLVRLPANRIEPIFHWRILCPTFSWAGTGRNG